MASLRDWSMEDAVDWSVCPAARRSLDCCRLPVTASPPADCLSSRGRDEDDDTTDSVLSEISIQGLVAMVARCSGETIGSKLVRIVEICGLLLVSLPESVQLYYKRARGTGKARETGT